MKYAILVEVDLTSILLIKLILDPLTIFGVGCTSK